MLYYRAFAHRYVGEESPMYVFRDCDFVAVDKLIIKRNSRKNLHYYLEYSFEVAAKILIKILM
jgi:hypothetical protein